MLFLGLGLGGLLVVVGGLTYWLAPIVGPNPIFGVRIGYAYASREAWDKTNRYGGALIALVGVGTAMVGLGLQSLNFTLDNGMFILVGFNLVAMLMATGSMFAYARSVGQATAIAHELVPVRFRWMYFAPVLVTFAMLVAFIVYLYPTLPANHVPSHFNIRDQADNWQSRDDFLKTFLGLGALFVALNVGAVFIAMREPLISFSRWGAGWRLDPEKGLIFTGMIFALVELLFVALLWNIWWLTQRGVLAFSFFLILPVSVILIGAIIALFFGLARREPSP
jgi:uncharacterized membrane protein